MKRSPKALSRMVKDKAKTLAQICEQILSAGWNVSLSIHNDKEVRVVSLTPAPRDQQAVSISVRVSRNVTEEI